LLEKLLRAEDVQLLYGTGVSPNLSGITTAGNFTAPTQNGATDAEQLIKAIAQLEGLDREANGILVHPRDFYQMMLWKSTSIYNLPGGNITNLITFENGQLRIAGCPVYRSTAMREGKFIAGDWLMGASLITRDAPKIEIFFEDGFNVRRNQVTVRVEERVAFPIYGSDFFIFGNMGLS
jgi:HK97 family phage major capsid protein